MSDKETVIDAESVSDKRIRDIFEARRKLNRKRAQIVERQFTDPQTQLHKESLLGIYRGHVETYFTEIEPLFYRTEEGRELWEEKPFGMLIVSPPVVSKSGPNHATGSTMLEDSAGNQIQVSDIPEPVEVNLVGLSCLLDLPNPVEVPFNVEQSATQHSGETSVVETTQIDMKTIDSMVREANAYLSGIGLQPDLDQTGESTQLENVEL